MQEIRYSCSDFKKTLNTRPAEDIWHRAGHVQEVRSIFMQRKANSLV